MRVRALLGLGILVVVGCGYAPIAELGAVGPSLVVVAGRSDSVDPAAAEALLAGARSELGRARRLASCDPATDRSCTSLVLELTAIDAESAGVSRAGEAPLALGLRAVATGRAQVRRGGGPGAAYVIEASASEVLAQPTGAASAPASALLARQEAGRRAAFSLGVELARRASSAGQRR